MIHLFSILYLSWALWRRDWALYEFDFDIRLSPPIPRKRNPYEALVKASNQVVLAIKNMAYHFSKIKIEL